MMLPTARAARGRPAIAATSPYVATRPGGMRRTTVSTRCWNSGSGISEFRFQRSDLFQDLWIPSIHQSANQSAI
jgi:hypothetical protein